MPQLEYTLESEYTPGFKTDAIASMFDIPPQEKLTKTWKIDLPIEDLDWKIGLIYGPSGSGKSSISKKIWPDFYHEGYQWDDRAVVENFPKSAKIKDITKALSSVGFSSPPDWIKRYAHLSTGQKFRAEIARLLLDDENYPEIVVLDEFTSVLDRDVAKASSAAVQRYIRASNKKFVAVTCHSDIIEWLNPDWFYEVSSGQFQLARGSHRPSHPPIELRIARIQREAWDQFGFGTHHYLNPKLEAAGHLWGGFWKDKLIAAALIKKVPHQFVPNMWNFSRIVTLPDYQGLRIGVVMTDLLSHHYCHQLGQRMFLNTTHPAMNTHALNSDQWMLSQKARYVGKPSKKGKMTGNSKGRPIPSYEYCGHIRGNLVGQSLTYEGDSERDKEIFFKTVKRI